MEFYYSETWEIDDLNGVHLFVDSFGTNHRAPWDDFDYVVTFKVYLVKDGTRTGLGFIRILVNGENYTAKYLKNNGTQMPDQKVYKVGHLLNPSNAVSLANEIDYYYKLRKLLNEEEMVQFLKGICDGAFYYANFNDFKEWPGFSGSIFRNKSVSEAILRKGFQIAMGSYAPEDTFTVNVSTLPSTFGQVGFSFDNTSSIGKTNVNVMIGKNGLGKSYIINHITKLMTGLMDNPESWPYFHKLVVVGFSPFETFYTQNTLLKALDQKYTTSKIKLSNKEKIVRKLRINEYAYIGFRNSEGVFDPSWPKQYSAKSLVKVIEYDNDNSWWSDKSRFDLLSETLRLSLKFDHICLSLKKGGVLSLDKGVLGSIQQYKHEILYEEGISFIKDGILQQLSSGQMMYSYMLPALVAEIEDESLLLIDEPELYLHPTLEVGLISMLKHLLEKTSSYAIIATHSAVMAREVPKEGVRILRESEFGTRVVDPTFQTLGESLDLVIGEAFDDYVTKKQYEKDLDVSVSAFSTLSEAISVLAPQVGDDALSYLTSKLKRSKLSDVVVEVRE